ncbi:MAG: hypothetical protein ACFFGP_06360 [Promethearchaeota archaeon]
MIILEDSIPEIIDGHHPLEMLGLGLVSITPRNHNVILHKGMGTPLLNKLIKLYKDEIIQKREGKIIDLLGSFTVYIHFYEVEREIITIFYVNEKDKLIKYESLCSISNILLRCYCSNVSTLELNRVCNKIIPCVKGISALFIIYNSGHSLFNKINKEKKFLADNYIQVSGFISAILAFSKEVIGRESGESLQAINFENERFFVHVRDNVIFAYLIDKKNESKNLKRFIELIADEFMELFNTNLKDFNGDVTPFGDFERIVNNYLII